MWRLRLRRWGGDGVLLGDVAHKNTDARLAEPQAIIACTMVCTCTCLWESRKRGLNGTKAEGSGSDFGGSFFLFSFFLLRVRARPARSKLNNSLEPPWLPSVDVVATSLQQGGDEGEEAEKGITSRRLRSGRLPVPNTNQRAHEMP